MQTKSCARVFRWSTESSIILRAGAEPDTKAGKSRRAWYYSNEDGSVKTNEWFVHDKRTYHVDENGVMSTGLQKIDGTLYYFESWGGAGFQGWKKSAEHGT